MTMPKTTEFGGQCCVDVVFDKEKLTGSDVRLGEVHGEEALDERRRGEVPRPAGIEDVKQYRVGRVVAVRGHRVVVVEIGAGAEGGHRLGVGVEEGGLGRLEVVLLERVLLPTRLQKDVEVIAIVGVR